MKNIPISIKVVLGLNIVYFFLAGGEIMIYILTLPISLPISILIYYLININTKKPTIAKEKASAITVTTVNKTSIKKDETPTISKQNFNKHLVFRILISSLLSPIILLIAFPLIEFIVEPKNSGDWISMGGITTVFVSVIIYPFLTYFIYRILPKDFVFPKLTPLQITLLIALIPIVLMLLLYLINSE